ncbi:MAG TPA: hypothetical protein VGC88_08790, partial [Terriglobales bacterium]
MPRNVVAPFRPVEAPERKPRMPHAASIKFNPEFGTPAYPRISEQVVAWTAFDQHFAPHKRTCEFHRNMTRQM